MHPEVNRKNLSDDSYWWTEVILTILCTFFFSKTNEILRIGPPHLPPLLMGAGDDWKV